MQTDTERPITAVIAELSSLWMKVISWDHHKDRDCHWYVTEKYSYGGPPQYLVQHHGYIYREVDAAFPTRLEAQIGLGLEIAHALYDQIAWATRSLKDKHEVSFLTDEDINMLLMVKGLLPAVEDLETEILTFVAKQ